MAALGFRFGIPESVLSTATVNDVAVKGDQELHDGDKVSPFPCGW